MSKKKQRVKFETNFAKLGTVLQGQTGRLKVRELDLSRAISFSRQDLLFAGIAYGRSNSLMNNASQFDSLSTER